MLSTCFPGFARVTLHTHKGLSWVPAPRYHFLPHLHGKHPAPSACLPTQHFKQKHLSVSKHAFSKRFGTASQPGLALRAGKCPSPPSPSKRRSQGQTQAARIPPAGYSPYVVIILLVSRKSRMPFGEDTSNCSRWDLTERQGINWSSDIPGSKNKAKTPAPPRAAVYWGTLLPVLLPRAQQNALIRWRTLLFITKA